MNSKTFVIGKKDNLLFCLIDYLFLITLYNDIFVSPKIKYDIRSIFDTQVLTWKKCLIIKITKEALDKPVFR